MYASWEVLSAYLAEEPFLAQTVGGYITLYETSLERARLLH